MRRKVLISLALVAAALVPAGASGHASGLVWSSPVNPGDAPVIDGTVGAAEWGAASSVSVPFGGHPTTVRFMRDANHLYIAATVTDNSQPVGSSFTAFFDNNHSGVRDVGDDAIGASTSAQGSQGGDFFWNGTTDAADVSDGGTSDVAGAGTTTPKSVSFEIRHPLAPTTTATTSASAPTARRSASTCSTQARAPAPCAASPRTTSGTRAPGPTSRFRPRAPRSRRRASRSARPRPLTRAPRPSRSPTSRCRRCGRADHRLHGPRRDRPGWNRLGGIGLGGIGLGGIPIGEIGLGGIGLGGIGLGGIGLGGIGLTPENLVQNGLGGIPLSTSAALATAMGGPPCRNAVRRPPAPKRNARRRHQYVGRQRRDVGRSRSLRDGARWDRPRRYRPRWNWPRRHRARPHRPRRHPNRRRHHDRREPRGLVQLHQPAGGIRGQLLRRLVAVQPDDDRTRAVGRPARRRALGQHLPQQHRPRRNRPGRDRARRHRDRRSRARRDRPRRDRPGRDRPWRHRHVQRRPGRD